MVDEMNLSPNEAESDDSWTKRPAARDSGAVSQLPTLQRNALRKIFDRPEFTPAEVAALGYKRLHQAEGVGQKGLAAITTWLESYGFELKPPLLSGDARQQLPKNTRKNIEIAVRLLRTHGYIVQKIVDEAAPGRSR